MKRCTAHILLLLFIKFSMPIGISAQVMDLTAGTSSCCMTTASIQCLEDSTEDGLLASSTSAQDVPCNDQDNCDCVDCLCCHAPFTAGTSTIQPTFTGMIGQYDFFFGDSFCLSPSDQVWQPPRGLS